MISNVGSAAQLLRQGASALQKSASADGGNWSKDRRDDRVSRAEDLFQTGAEERRNGVQDILAGLLSKTTFMSAAQEQKADLVRQMEGIRQALLNPKNNRAGGAGGRTEQIAITQAQKAGKPILGMRDATELRPVYETRDVTEQRDIFETRDITETRPVYEDSPIYNTLTVTGLTKIANASKISSTGVTAGSTFKVQVGDGPEAVVTLRSDTQIDIKVGTGATESFIIGDKDEDGGEDGGAYSSWTTALTSALGRVSGLSASFNVEGQLTLSATAASSIKLTDGTGSPLEIWGFTPGTHAISTATITGTGKLDKLTDTTWANTGFEAGEAFSVQVGSGPAAAVEFYASGEIRLHRGDGSAPQSFTYLDVGGNWRSAMLSALNEIDGLDASYSSDGQLQLKAERNDTALTVADVSGDPLKIIGMTAGATQGAIVGYQQVQVGEETVTYQEQVKVGEETVVVGQEQVKIGGTHVQEGKALRTGRDDEIIGFRTGEVGRGALEVRSADIGGALEKARKTLDQVKSSWKSAGLDLELSAESIGLGTGFLSGIENNEVLRDRLSGLEKGIAVLRSDLGHILRVGQNGSFPSPNVLSEATTNDEALALFSAPLVAAQEQRNQASRQASISPYVQIPAVYARAAGKIA